MPTRADRRRDTRARRGCGEAAISPYFHTILHVGVGPHAMALDLRRPIDRRARRALHRLGLVDRFAVITACNPDGIVLSDAENRERTAALARELRRRDVRVAEVEGRSPDGTHREPGYAAVPLDHWAARDIARRFEQLAFYWYDGARMWLLGAGAMCPPTPLPAPAIAAGDERPVALTRRLYVIRLDPAVLGVNAFREANPDYVEGRPCVYVGSTGIPVEERFLQHLLGYKSNGYARRFGRELMYGRFDGLPLMTHDDALRAERALAARLRAHGWAVWQG